MPPFPSVDDLTQIVIRCAKQRNLALALRLQALMCPTGSDTHPALGKDLVLMWAHVESMERAQQAFDRLSQPNENSWIALLTGYIHHEKSQQALSVYRAMAAQYDSSCLSPSTFVALLKASTHLKDLEMGVCLHTEIARQEIYGEDEFVGSALINLYAKCGSLAIAQELFGSFKVRDVVSWTTIIKACVEHGCNEEALDLFHQMLGEGVVPDAFTYTCTLKACSSLGAADMGQEVHAEIARKGLEEVTLVANTLVDMYAKCGFLVEARDTLQKRTLQNMVSWTALIAGYAEHGPADEAIKCYEKLQSEGIDADAITFACTVKACGTVGALREGQVLHAQIAEEGLERELLVGSSLVDMYTKCSLLEEAQEVFYKLQARSTITWTALITGYLEAELNEEALYHLELMQCEEVIPDTLTYVCVLKACGRLRSTSKGQERHTDIVMKGMEQDLLVGNALVDMYAKCALLSEAQDAFIKLSARDLVSWNSRLAGYAEHGCWQEALDAFEQMQQAKVLPNDITYLCSLKACGLAGAQGYGEEIHARAARDGLDRQLSVGNALIDMYAKCGSLAEAQAMFDKFAVQDDVAWNALLTGYAQVGESAKVFHIFHVMVVREAIKPNLVTFVALLNVSSHAGLVDEGGLYFKALEEHGLSPTLEIYICMVDLLGRAGLVEEAVVVAKRMAYLPDAVVWHVVLGACQKGGGNVDLAAQALLHAVLLNEMDTAAYVTMCNVHTTLQSITWPH